MKTKFTLFVIAVTGFMLLPDFTFASTNQADDEIPLAGSLESTIQRSLFADLSVTVDANTLNIEYWKDYTNITIEVTDETGQSVYKKIVNPVAGKSLTIDISDWDPGSYHISFTNTSGGCIYGDFDVVH